MTRAVARSGRLRVGFNARVLANPATRGWTRYTSELLRALSRSDELDLVLFTREALSPRHLRGVRAEVVAFDARRESIWRERDLPRNLRKHGIDVFHAPADRGLPLLPGCPTVVTIHNSLERARWRELWPSTKQRAAYWAGEIENWLADAAITVSETTRDELIRRRVARSDRLHVVYPAPAPEFQPERRSADGAVVRRHSISPPFILYVGAYDVHKDVDTLVRAFDAAGLEGHDLVIAAPKQGRFTELSQQWHTLSCSRRIKLIEAADEELPSLYREALFFVNPAHSEAFSFQVVEAMTCGTPLVAADGGALPEVADGAALLFEPQNHAQLAELLRRVATGAEERSELRDRGLARARDFSWPATAARTAAVYRGIVRGGSP